MAVQKGQPTVRFSKAGPFSREGVSPVPKVVTFKKTAISGTSNDDFWVAPAGVFVSHAFIRADVELDGTPTVELGLDGDADELIDTTDFDATTAGNWACSLGSGTADGARGVYLEAGDTIRLAIGGAPTQGELSGYIMYFEMDDILDDGVHFDLT
jgi:hypothetical protein